MPVQNLKYCEYFDVDEKYFPCIDESAINSGAAWNTTYPHQTFIDLLNLTEKMLGGNTNRSIWIHGAYGTGKSQCAYTLKKLLEVPEAEVRAYWNKYEPLKKNPVLLEKFIGHKAQGIVTAYRYASGSITTPQQLFFAVQESIRKALDAHGVSYKGENSLKESVIHIVIIKKSVDEMIDKAFKNSGKISIGEIYDHLETTFGFSACNLSAFITGFLLKEYSAEPYRSMDAEGHRDSMTPDKLSEMIGNYIGKNPKSTYIVSLTDEEKAFYELTENAWNIAANTCSSPQQAGTLVLSKMRDLSYPVWCLEDVDPTGVFDLVKLYIRLVQSKGDEAHDVANEIGKIATQRPSSAQNLKTLLTLENCKKGMCIFLERFENGKLLNVAAEIGAENSVLTDIKKLFSVQYSALWIGSTGEDEIRKLITEYEVVKSTNLFLNVSAHSKDAAFREWRETLKFIGFSCESVRAKRPSLDKFFYHLLRISNYEDMLPDNMESFLEEMTDHTADIREVLDHPLAIFMEVYAPYLDGFTDVECEEIKNSITAEMFTTSSTASNATVKKAAEDYRKNQVKTQLYKLWNDKTGGTKNPRIWSEKYRTPILCCIKESQYTAAKKAFATLNSSTQSEADIKDALVFLQTADFFEEIVSADYRDKCFARCIIGDYTSLISDLDAVRDALESTGIDAYEWNDNPSIRSKVSSMAEAEYNAGGSDKVVDIIKGMKDVELKKWLTDIVRKDMGLGVKIIINREE